jgi:hypothetical protein
MLLPGSFQAASRTFPPAPSPASVHLAPLQGPDKRTGNNTTGSSLTAAAAAGSAAAAAAAGSAAAIQAAKQAAQQQQYQQQQEAISGFLTIKRSSCPVSHLPSLTPAQSHTCPAKLLQHFQSPMTYDRHQLATP